MLGWKAAHTRSQFRFQEANGVTADLPDLPLDILLEIMKFSGSSIASTIGLMSKQTYQLYLNHQCINMGPLVGLPPTCVKRRRILEIARANAFRCCACKHGVNIKCITKRKEIILALRARQDIDIRLLCGYCHEDWSVVVKSVNSFLRPNSGIASHSILYGTMSSRKRLDAVERIMNATTELDIFEIFDAPKISFLLYNYPTVRFCCLEPAGGVLYEHNRLLRSHGSSCTSTIVMDRDFPAHIRLYSLLRTLLIVCVSSAGFAT